MEREETPREKGERVEDGVRRGERVDPDAGSVAAEEHERDEAADDDAGDELERLPEHVDRLPGEMRDAETQAG
jgi:hypothetical protein